MEHMHDLLPRIFRWVPPLDFVGAVAACCRQFTFRWYVGLFPCVVVVPDDVPSINAAINRLARHREKNSANDGRGLVILRPGTYAESVRVTQNCHVLGLGRPGQVVVEAPGWESALVFSGLGVRGFGSGEDACIYNITFKCRNEQMRGRCVYIVLGQPRLERCDIDGGVLISGLRTAPQIRSCRIRASWGSGLHLTDHCQASLRESLVVGNRRHGVLVDRSSHPDITANKVSNNGECGIRLFLGPGFVHSQIDLDHAVPASFVGTILDNDFSGNGGRDLSLTPRFADSEELQIDVDENSPEDAGLCTLEPDHRPCGIDADDDAEFVVFAAVGFEDINWGL